MAAVHAITAVEQDHLMQRHRDLRGVGIHILRSQCGREMIPDKQLPLCPTAPLFDRQMR